MKRQTNSQAESFINSQKRRGWLRRGVALLSAFVMLFTMNTLKKSADTLERVPTCGYEYEHHHTEACYDAAGHLICGLHEHTDACYQQRPTKAAEVVAVERSVDEVELDLGGDVPAEAQDAEIVDDTFAEDAASYVYEIGDRESVRLSDVLARVNLPLDYGEIEVVGAVDAGPTELIAVADAGDDYVISPMRSFDSAELGIVTGDNVYVIELRDAEVLEVAAEEETIQAESADAVEDEETAEEPAAEPVVETAEEPAAEPVEEKAEEPVAEPVVETAEEPAAEPDEEPVEEPAAEPVVEKAEESVVEPVVETVEEPAAEPDEETAVETVVEDNGTEETDAEPVEGMDEDPADNTDADVEPSEENKDDQIVEETEEPAVEETEEPAVEETEEPVVEETEEPVVEETEEPTVEETEEPVVEETEEPVVEATEEPAVEETEEPAVEETEEPVVETTEEPAVEETEEPVVEETEEPVVEETEEPVVEETEEPVVEETEEPAVEETEEPVVEETEGPAVEETEEPVVEETEEPVVEETEEPVVEETEELVVEETEEPVVEETEESVIEETEEPVVEATEEPVVEETEEPAVEETEEPAVEETEEPVVEETEEPVVEETEEPTVEETEEPVVEETEEPVVEETEEPVETAEPASNPIIIVETETTAVVETEETVEPTETVEPEENVEPIETPEIEETEEPEAELTEEPTLEPEEEAAEEPTEEPTEAPDEVPELFSRTVEVDGSDAVVTLSWGPEAEIPEDVEIEIYEIERGTELYDLLYDQAMAALSEGQSAEDATTQVMRFFDITLYVDGEEYEPKAPVYVDVQVKEAEEATQDDQVNAIHYEKTGETAKVVEATTTEDDAVVSFEAKSFSVYGVSVSRPAQQAQAQADVTVDLSDVDALIDEAKTVEKSEGTVILSVPKLLAIDSDAVQGAELAFDPANTKTMAGAKYAAEGDVEVLKDGTVVLPTDALEDSVVSLEVKTAETRNYVTTITTHTVDITLTGYAGRTDALTSEDDAVQITAVEGNSLPADAVVALETVAVPEKIANTIAGDAASAEDAGEPADAPTADSADATLGTVENAVAYDITINSKNGTELSETGAVTVVVSPEALNVLEDVPEGAEIKDITYTLYHIHDNGETEQIPLDAGAVVVDGDGNVASFCFETESFSTYVLKYTVDFEYTDPETGEKNKYSALGKGSYRLADILAELGIVGELTNAELELVSGSLEEGALYLTTVDGEYYINSYLPFTDTYELTVVVDGETYIIHVTDAAEYVTNIADLLASAAITVDGKKITGDEWSVRANQNYTISLRFKETSTKQFSNSEPMIYYLPEGFNISSLDSNTSGKTSTTFDVVVDGKVVSGNTIEIKGDTNGKKYLEIKWNEDDENFKNLASAGTTSIVIDIVGTFSENTTSVTFSDSVENSVTVDTSSNVSIQKQGWYDKDNQKIHYTVTATSVGNSTNVVVRDVINGTAVKMENDDNITMRRSSDNRTNDISDAKNGDGKGFQYTIGNMANGETVTFEYTATVDPSKIGKSGQATVDETGNTVNITANADGNPNDNTSTHYESGIGFNASIHKNSTAISDMITVGSGDDEKHYKVVTWKVELNSEKQVAMYDSDLKDTIVDWDRGIMSYTGDGIRISVDDAAATTVSWGALGVTTDTTGTGIREDSSKTWTYRFKNEEDKQPHKYVVEYDTLVEIKDLNQNVTASNTIEGKPGTDTAYGPVNQGGTQGGEGGEENPGPVGPAVNKAVTAVNEEEITWKINVVVSGDGYNNFYIEDLFPVESTHNWRYDVLKSVSVVSGLLAGEHFVQEEVLDKRTWNGETSQLENVEYIKGVRLTFYKSDGTSEPGLQKNVTSRDESGNEITSDRVLTLSITTQNNALWMIDSEINSNIGVHTNTVNVYTDAGNSSDTAEVSPRRKKMTKFAILSYESAAHEAYASETIDGVQYPVYKFELLLEGVTQETVTITDIFDTDALKVFNGHYDGEAVDDNPYLTRDGHDLNTIMGGANANLSKNYTTRYPVTIVDTSTGAQITATLPKTQDGAFYPYYRLIYYLVPNGEDGLARMKALAIDNDGTAVLTNSARLDSTTTSSTTVNYEYKPVSKKVTGPNASGVYHYTVTLNPDKKRLNNGNPLPATDTFENMSVDYTSITVTTDPADRKNEVTWDYSGSTGYFTIPDATKVILEYDARPISSDPSATSVSMKNTIEMKGMSVTTDTNATIDVHGSGEAYTARLYLLKYAKGDMTVPLAGAVFGLYEENASGQKEPMQYQNGTNGKRGNITFTTGSNGIAEIFLSQSEDGVFLQHEYYEYDSLNEIYEYHAGKTYYLKELTPPAGYGLLSNPEYYSFKITDIPSHVKYGEDGQYVYLNRDTLKIVNEPEAGLRIKKIVSGVEELSQEEINRISFTVTGPGGYSRTIPYSDFVNGQYKLPDETDKTEHPEWRSMPTGTYTVTETVTTADGATFTTTYKVDSARTTTTDNAQTEINSDDIANNRDHVVTVTNTYTTADITVIKTDKDSGTKLAGATFKLEKQQAGGGYAVFANAALTAEGLFTFTDDNKDAGVTISGLLDGHYKLTETVAPDGGYSALTTPVEFTVSNGAVSFTNGSSFEDGIVTLDDGTFTIANEKKQLIVKKEWVGGTPESATVYFKLLMSNDSWATNRNYQYYTSQYNYTELFTLNSSNNWTMTFEGLDASYVYRPVELNGNWLEADERAEGSVISFNGTDYTVSYSGTEFGPSGTAVITNTKVPTGIAVLKKWDVENSDDIKPVTVQLMKGTADYGSSPKVQVTLQSKQNNFSVTKSLYVANGADVTVFVDQWWDKDGSSFEGINADAISVGGGRFILSEVQSDYTIVIERNDFRNDWPTGFSLTTNSEAPFTLTNTTTEGSPVTLNTSNNWYYEWTSLDDSYYYYIIETAVDGTALASTTYEPTYTNNNGITTGTITVTNSKTTPQTGSLKLTKAVTVGTSPVTDANKALTNGSYTFTVTSTGSITPAVNKTVVITVNDGAVQSATVDGATMSLVDGYVVIGELAEGDYEIAEIEASSTNKAMVLTGAAGGTGVSNDKVVTVHVTAGQDTPEATATATFTNDYPLTEVPVKKVWAPSAPSFVDSVAFSLYTDATCTTPATDALGANVAEATLNSTNDWKATFTNLPAKNSTGAAIAYYIKETKVTYHSDGIQDARVLTTESDIAKLFAVSNVTETTEGTTTYKTITNTLTPVNIKIIKVDKNNDAKRLTGAEFQMKRKLQGESDFTVFENDAFAEDNQTNKRTGVFAVNASGEASINGLLPGAYQVQETKAPAGYIIKDSDFTFTVNTDGTVTYTNTDTVTYNAANKEFTVKNEPGVALPATGGPGTTLYTIGGASLLLLAALGLVWKGRKRCHGDGI